MPKCAKCDNVQTRLSKDKLCRTCRNPVEPHLNNGDGNTSNENADNDLSETLLHTSLSDINVAQLLSIIQSANNDLKEDIRSDIINEVNAVEKRVSLLEKENKDLNEHVGILTGIIVDM